jgi:hypothetical protein
MLELASLYAQIAGSGLLGCYQPSFMESVSA